MLVVNVMQKYYIYKRITVSSASQHPDTPSDHDQRCVEIPENYIHPGHNHSEFPARGHCCIGL